LIDCATDSPQIAVMELALKPVNGRSHGSDC